MAYGNSVDTKHYRDISKYEANFIWFSKYTSIKRLKMKRSARGGGTENEQLEIKEKQILQL